MDKKLAELTRDYEADPNPNLGFQILNLAMRNPNFPEAIAEFFQDFSNRTFPISINVDIDEEDNKYNWRNPNIENIINIQNGESYLISILKNIYRLIFDEIKKSPGVKKIFDRLRAQQEYEQSIYEPDPEYPDEDFSFTTLANYLKGLKAAINDFGNVKCDFESHIEFLDGEHFELDFIEEFQGEYDEKTTEYEMGVIRSDYPRPPGILVLDDETRCAQRVLHVLQKSLLLYYISFRLEENQDTDASDFFIHIPSISALLGDDIEILTPDDEEFDSVFFLSQMLKSLVIADLFLIMCDKAHDMRTKMLSHSELMDEGFKVRDAAREELRKSSSLDPIRDRGEALISEGVSLIEAFDASLQQGNFNNAVSERIFQVIGFPIPYAIEEIQEINNIHDADIIFARRIEELLESTTIPKVINYQQKSKKGAEFYKNEVVNLAHTSLKSFQIRFLPIVIHETIGYFVFKE